MTTRQYLRGRWTRTVLSAIALFAAEGILEHFLVDEGTSDYFLRATVLLAFACLLWCLSLPRSIQRRLRPFSAQFS